MEASVPKRRRIADAAFPGSEEQRVPSTSNWLGLHLQDELLAIVLSKLGDTIVLAAGVQNDLLAASQVCSRMRRIVHKTVAKECIIRQPHLSPSQPTNLAPLPLHSYSAVTRLDLSQCLDWIQHPSLRTLADLSALRVMTQLKSVDLRPLLDHIDSSSSFRIKSVTEVLCWADGVMLRIWDRWRLAPQAAVSGLFNVMALADLPCLESVTFPITERHTEDTQDRLTIAPKLSKLTQLTVGRATPDTIALSALPSASSLRSLCLGKCGDFTDTELEVLARLTSLETLYLYGCGMMQLSSTAWNPLTRLQRLLSLALFGKNEGENVHFWGTSDTSAIPMTSAGLETLCTLSQLQKLRLSGCRNLGGRALLAVTALAELTALELNNCIVESIVLPSIINSLPSLRSLQLRRIKGGYLELHLCTLSRLSNLAKLSLDQCTTVPALDNISLMEMQQSFLSCISNISCLEGLQLWQHNAQYMNLTMCTVVGALQQLTRVCISSCHVTDALLASIAKLSNLRVLELANCEQVGNAGLQHLSGLRMLQNLDLYAAPLIGDEGLAAIAGCTNLLSFRIIQSAISDKSMEFISKWRNLRNLSLVGAPITDEGLKLMPELTSVKILDLAACRHITDNGLRNLQKMGELRQLNLESCRQITNSGVDQFRDTILAAGPPGFAGSGGGIIVFF